LIGLKLANSKISEGRSELERGTLQATEEVILEGVLLLIDIVHDGGENRWLDLPHLGS
jgi:hypothetical protein